MALAPADRRLVLRENAIALATPGPV
jgi:hypothetical protein